MNSRNLFYVRDLQIKFFFKNSEIIRSLFFLEYYLFNLNIKVDEILVFKLKLKWLYDEIDKNHFNNEITSNLLPFKDKILKKKVLKIVETFSDLIYPIQIRNIEETFEKLNKEFNFIIHQEYLRFDSSFRFQMIQYLYNNRLYELEYLKKTFQILSGIYQTILKKLLLKFFFKNCVQKNKKISKTNYLINLIFNIQNK